MRPWRHAYRGCAMRKALLIVSAFILSVALAVNASASDYVPSKEIEEAAEKYGEEYGTGKYILLAIMRYESCYVPDVHSGQCKGLMQINEPYHAERMERLGVSDLYDIDSNVHVGADYIAELYQSYGDWGIVLGCYHGEKKAVSNGRKGIYSKYSLKILAYASDLEEDEDGKE